MTDSIHAAIVLRAQNMLASFNDTYFQHHRWIDAYDALEGLAYLHGFYGERTRDPQTYDLEYYRPACQSCGWAAVAIKAELREQPAERFWEPAITAARVAAQMAKRLARPCLAKGGDGTPPSHWAIVP